MAEAITFDTHRFVKNLTANGFTEAQAEALADEHVHLLNSNLATKADIEKLRLANKTDLEKARLANKADIEKVGLTNKTDLEKVRADLEVKIEAVKADILKWMVTALIAQTGLIVALIRLL